MRLPDGFNINVFIKANDFIFTKIFNLWISHIFRKKIFHRVAT